MGLKERLDAAMACKPIVRKMEDRDLAILSTVHSKTIKAIRKAEDGKMSDLQKICDPLGITVDWLVNGIGDPPTDDQDLAGPGKGCGCKNGDFCPICDDDECDGDESKETYMRVCNDANKGAVPPPEPCVYDIGCIGCEHDGRAVRGKGK